MKTTIIGFPRVGSLRELKFASEKYFRKEITAQELQDTDKNTSEYTLESAKDKRHHMDPDKRFFVL